MITRSLSVARPSVVNFSHFRLLLWNRGTEFAETWQEAITQRPLPKLCFSGQNLSGSKISMSSTKFVFSADRKDQMAARHLICWDIFRLLLWNSWREFNEILQEVKSQRPLPSLCFWADRKNKMATRPVIGWNIFDFSETTEGNKTWAEAIS